VDKLAISATSIKSYSRAFDVIWKRINYTERTFLNWFDCSKWNTRGNYLRTNFVLNLPISTIYQISVSVSYFLHCALAAAQCIVIGPVCLQRAGGQVGGSAVFVGGFVTTITRNCVYRSWPKNGFVSKCSDHLQLIKFWSSRVPGKGSAAWRKLRLASLWALFSLKTVCWSKDDHHVSYQMDYKSGQIDG